MRCKEFNDGFLIETNKVLYDKDGDPLERVILQVKVKNAFGGYGSQFSTPNRRFYKTSSDAFEKTVERRVTGYTLEGKDSVLPSTISREVYDQLSPSMKVKYSENEEYTEVLERVEFGEVESVSETVEEFFQKEGGEGVTVFYEDLTRKLAVDNQGLKSSLKKKIVELQGSVVWVLVSGSKVFYLDVPWNGEMKKVLHKKRNGQPYADRRGYMVKDFVKLDSVPLPSVEYNQFLEFDSEEKFDRFVTSLAEKLLKPQIPLRVVER